MIPRIVMDTNILMSALFSKRGTSYRFVSLIGSGHFELCLSVPVFVEYEDVTKRNLSKTYVTSTALRNLLSYIAKQSHHQAIYFLWRPFLRDPKDDMILELAVAAQCDYIVTFNQKDFVGVEEQFGIKIITPKPFLQQIGAIE